MSLLNYKFRLYPTPEQELVLEQTLDGCRWVYNYFLSIPPMSEYDMNYRWSTGKLRCRDRSAVKEAGRSPCLKAWVVHRTETPFERVQSNESLGPYHIFYKT